MQNSTRKLTQQFLQLILQVKCYWLKHVGAFGVLPVLMQHLVEVQGQTFPG